MKFNIILLSCILLLAACKKEDFKPKAKTYDTSKTENWMQDLIGKYPNQTITLKDICLPRAHDAGVYVLNNCVGGNECNTKTQDKSILLMLKSGVRVFDVRPTLIDGVYWTYHRQNCGGLGCEGELMQTFLQETRQFLDEHNELVIFEMNNLCNTGSYDANLIALFNQELGDRIFKLATPLPTNFIDTDLKEIIPAPNNGGKIIIMWDGINTNSSSPENGIFANSLIPFSGAYANNPDIDIVMADQIQKFNAFDFSSNKLFRFSYTMTLSTGLAVTCFSSPETATSIADIGLEARDQMPNRISDWITNGTFAANKIPNILSVDFANTTVTEQCILLSELSLQ